MCNFRVLFTVIVQLLLFSSFGQSNTIFYVHEDGLAHVITIENDPKMNLVMIKKDMYHITFNLSAGFLKRHDDFYKRMSNRTITVATQNYVPYVVMRTSNNETKLSGYIGELWLIIERVLQFRTVIKLAGFLEGQALLRTGAADVLLQPAVITGNNMGQYGFTRPVASSWYELYVRAPESQASPESHFTVWSPYLWMATLATMVLLIMAMRIMYNYGAFEENSRSYSHIDPLYHLHKEQDRLGNPNLGICILSVLGSIGSEGFQLRPSSASGRLLMITTLLFSLLLYNSYSAVLMASLAVTNPTLPFSNLEDVARKGTHALCVRNLSYAYMRLKERESNKEVAPRWRDVVSRKPCSNIVDNRDLEAALCEWGVAVLETPPNMGVVTENASLSCQMKQIRGQYFAVPVSLELRARFPYTSLINSYIHRLQTSGILHYLRTKWTAPSSVALEDESVPNTIVTLRHVQLILSLYVASIAYSFLLLLIEIAWFRRHNSHAQRLMKP